MNGTDLLGDVGSGEGSGEPPHVATASPSVVPQWLIGIAVLGAVLPIASWLRRRVSVSLLIAGWALSLSHGQPGFDRQDRLRHGDDYGVGILVDLVAFV